MVGVYFGVVSHAGLLRPEFDLGVPGGQRRTSVMALDSARVTMAAAPRYEAAPVSANDQAAAAPPARSMSVPVASTAVNSPPTVAPPVTAPPAVATAAPPPAAPAADQKLAPSTLAMAYQAPNIDKADTKGHAITILQLGDSHTSADFLTGEVRRRLQQTYGNGGTGYVTAGRPHIGVLSSTLKIDVSSGWTYKALQRSDDVDEFWMSGFNTIAEKAGETLTFTAAQPITFDVIEIEAIRKKDGGSIDIRLDGALEGSFDLAGDKVEPVVIRLVPDKGPTNKAREISIATKSDGIVSISSVAIYNTGAGLIYNSVGYPGASFVLLNQLDAKLFTADLHRINPQIVVLSFGTNEASKQNLDMALYTRKYEHVIARIRAALPSAQIVLIGPPAGEEMPAHCKDKAREKAVCRHAPEGNASDAKVAAKSREETEKDKAEKDKPDKCEWKTLPKLDAVRDAERKIAERNGFVYWNWASIMPKECGADRWRALDPPLMAKDHIHFTRAGYNKSAAALVEALAPMIDKLRSRSDAVSNN